MRLDDESFTLAYDRTGLMQLVGRLSKLQPKLVVVESTGGSQRQVVAALRTGGIAVAAVNPSWVRRHARGNEPAPKRDFHPLLISAFPRRIGPCGQSASGG